MENKYQNLHIFWRGYRFSDIEQIEIRNIIFKDKMIIINYIDSDSEDKRLLLAKRNYSIKID